MATRCLLDFMVAGTIPPGVSYYRVTQEDKHIGWAQSSIDTLPSFGGFIIQDLLEADVELLGQTLPTSVSSRAELGPALQLRRFSLESRGATGDLAATGEIYGDTLLILAFRQGESADTSRIALESPVVLEAAWPLRLAAQRVEVGSRYRLPVFDPVTRSARLPSRGSPGSTLGG